MLSYFTSLPYPDEGFYRHGGFHRGIRLQQLHRNRLCGNSGGKNGRGSLKLYGRNDSAGDLYHKRNRNRGLRIQPRPAVEEREILCEKKKADGSITRQEIITGFSDGVNVEMTRRGLSQGDTVLD